MKFNHKTKIFFLVVLFLGTAITQSSLPPYRAEINSVENAKDCLSTRITGSALEVVNHCSGKFYLYNEDGILNENFVIINSEEWNENYQKYQQLGKKTGKDYWGHHYLPVGFYDCYKDQQEIIVNGINVCDEDNLKSGNVVKYWTIKIFSKEDNQDIIVTGRTIYKEPSKKNPNELSNSLSIFLGSIFLFAISILLFAAFFTLLSLFKKHKGLKRNISRVIAIILILFGLYLSFLGIVFLVPVSFIRG